MAREDWEYPNVPKNLMQQVREAVININEGRPRPKYRSGNDFVVAAIVDLLEKEGQLEKTKMRVKA